MIDSVMLRLDRRSSRPLQAQLTTGLREAIASGRLAPGARLPGSRTLASQLGVSRTTAALALEALIDEGLLVARARSGSFVADQPPPLAMAPHPAPSPGGRPVRLSRLARARAQRTLEQVARARPIAFPLSRPALDAFPVDTWTRLLARRAARTSRAQLDYGGGQPALARAIATVVSASRGVRVDPAQVLIVGGGQRALELACAALVDPGDAVAVEDPGYPGAREAAVAAGARVVPCRVDEAGLVVAELPRRARLVHVTSACQFPLGVPLAFDRRAELLAWARRAGACVLEDDYDADFWFTGAPLPSLASLDRDGRVLLVGSFSRTMFPALRLGYLVVPPALVAGVAAVREARDPDLPSLTQLALADFIEGGHYAHHLRRMRVLYRARRAGMVAAARAIGLTVRPGAVGLHVVCDLPPRSDARAVVARAREVGLAAAALGDLQARGRAPPALVLGFGSVPLSRLRPAMAELAGAMAAAR